MAKISLGVHKKASNMTVRDDIGMYPLNIEIYVRIIKYFFHLLELAEQGNEFINPIACRGGEGRGEFIPHHQNISCHSETT